MEKKEEDTRPDTDEIDCDSVKQSIKSVAQQLMCELTIKIIRKAKGF